MAYNYDFNNLYSKNGNSYFRHGIILCGCLIVCRFPIGALLVFDTHTHFYKVFWMSRVPTSYFGGNYITQYFGHSNDDIIDMCSGSQHDLFPEKNNFFPPLQGYFLERVHMMHILHSAEIYDFCRLLYRYPVGFLQASI